jgi:hypothetical protein
LSFKIITLECPFPPTLPDPACSILAVETLPRSVQCHRP